MAKRPMPAWARAYKKKTGQSARARVTELVATRKKLGQTGANASRASARQSVAILGRHYRRAQASRRAARAEAKPAATKRNSTPRTNARASGARARSQGATHNNAPSHSRSRASSSSRGSRSSESKGFHDGGKGGKGGKSDESGGGKDAKKKEWQRSGMPSKSRAAVKALGKGGVKAARKVVRGHLAAGGRDLSKKQTQTIVRGRVSDAQEARRKAKKTKKS